VEIPLVCRRAGCRNRTESKRKILVERDLDTMVHSFAGAAITKYHKLNGLNNRNVLFTFLGARSPR
jgi:hypothetical protein